MLTGIEWNRTVVSQNRNKYIDKCSGQDLIGWEDTSIWSFLARSSGDKTLQYEYIKYEIYNNQNTPDNFIGTHGLFQTMSQHLFYFILYFFIFF